MSLSEQVMAQVRLLMPEVVDDRVDLLQIVCTAEVTAICGRLRPDVDPEDCQADLVTAAGMCAAAALLEMAGDERPEQFAVGDLTIRRGEGGKGPAYLRRQAALLMAPYLQSGIPFMGV